MKVELFWIPEHVGIKDNEAAEVAAKAAFHRPMIDVSFVLPNDAESSGTSGVSEMAICLAQHTKYKVDREKR